MCQQAQRLNGGPSARRYDAAVEAYQKALAIVSDPFQQAHLHVLCSEAETGAHRYPQALAQCDLAEQTLGPASGTPDPRWLSSWFEIQKERMGILSWLNDTGGYGQLIERVRPFVENHGSAEQRMSFFLSLLGWSLRRDRYAAGDLRRSNCSTNQSGPWSRTPYTCGTPASPMKPKTCSAGPRAQRATSDTCRPKVRHLVSPARPGPRPGCC